MSTISVTNINDGDAVTAASINNQVNTIVNDYNGNITAANLATNAVTTAKITNANVTPDKLNLGPLTNFVTTDETTTSTSYAALATAQAVTVTIGANGLALVMFSAGLYSVAAVKRVSVALSGANTVAANDNYSLRNDGATFVGSQGTAHLFTGLTPGSTTFTLQFSTASGTAHFIERRLTVVPL